ncbi:MAG TPA: DUF6677 family protein [Pyrinomonadaceae bacterium]|nr:DUF6677 family protein [Pyrinomonadaceae bacterium]
MEKEPILEEIIIPREKPGAEAWLAGGLAWAIPGAGHFYQGHVVRGLLLGGSVLAMYVVGWLLGGHLYGLYNAPETGFLAYVFGFCDLGTGLLYLLSLLSNIAVTDQSQLATSEYGDRFLMVAGLLNYLSMLDAFDVAAGRKK